MKNCVRLLIFFMITNAVAQNKIQVKYDAFFTKSKFQGILIFNQEEMFFKLIDPKFGSQQKYYLEVLSDDEASVTENNMRTPTLVELYKRSSADYYILDFPSETGGVVINVIDRVPAMNWKIIPNSEKRILGFSCQRAEATFRGSKIVAYFTIEIPSVFGPEKFGGLPGLILEVYDNTPGYNNSYSAYEINLNYDEELKKIRKSKSVIDYKTHMVRNDSIAKTSTDEFLKKMKALSPRGYRTQKEGSQKRLGFEKAFEWEKN